VFLSYCFVNPFVFAILGRYIMGLFFYWNWNFLPKIDCFIMFSIELDFIDVLIRILLLNKIALLSTIFISFREII